MKQHNPTKLISEMAKTIKELTERNAQLERLGQDIYNAEISNHCDFGTGDLIGSAHCETCQALKAWEDRNGR